MKLHEATTEVRLRPITLLLRCALDQIEPSAVSMPVIPSMSVFCEYITEKMVHIVTDKTLSLALLLSV